MRITEKKYPLRGYMLYLRVVELMKPNFYMAVNKAGDHRAVHPGGQVI